jgi:hypothetical protein
MAIQPYKVQGVWVFDDSAAGLVREPFVAGADVLIDRMVAHIPDAESGVTLVFSGNPFPGYQHEFQRRREEYGGRWYHSDEYQMEGWLCPAMFKYFDAAPEKLYVEVKAKGEEFGRLAH